MRKNNFGTRRTRSTTFKCIVCERMTRDTGQDVDHLCEDCFAIAGIDNQINDGGPGEREQFTAELAERLAHIAKLGGNVQSVKDNNGYAFPGGAS